MKVLASSARFASSRPARMAGICLLAAALSVSSTAPVIAQASLTAWQEIVVLALVKARHAATACGFRENVGPANSLLASANLTAEVLAPTQPLSAAMRRQVQADQDAYAGDHDGACQQAWDRFGADGAPGVRDLLTR